MLVLLELRLPRYLAPNKKTPLVARGGMGADAPVVAALLG